MSGKALFPLTQQQLAAVLPARNIWLAASAGTGKTQVLSARVFRLLLQEKVQPENILCLTFTKAGATEMASRINERLARWVQLDAAALAGDLRAIGAPVDPETQARARTLFAAVLDAPGGGLRIQTIHGFCQSLLAAFPMEAGIAPGFAAMEERDQTLLAENVLGDMLVEAKRQGDARLLENVAGISLRLGEEDARGYLLRCAKALDLWTEWTGDLRPRVNALFGLPRGELGDGVAELCSDDTIDTAAIRELAGWNCQWGTKTGVERADAAAAWLALEAEARSANLDLILSAFLTKQGAPFALTKGLEKIAPDYAERAAPVIETLVAISERLTLIELAETCTRGLEAGRAFSFAYRDAKRREGVMDFDDLIRDAARLLNEGGMSEWVRYKLDRQYDHILVDEAQDTNIDQWRIVAGLISDFFAGEGVKPERTRTLFTVGDTKQAIYGFQGTSPENYLAARHSFFEQAEGSDTPFSALSLDHSFRSAQPILDLVDMSIEQIGSEQLGLDAPASRHEGEKRPGQVTLWGAVKARSDEDDDGPGEEGQENWLPKPSRVFAERLAGQISQWLDKGLWLAKENRPARAGDIMVLVRARKDLAALIVARLHAHAIPVAGIDRLRLGQPLAIQDLTAAAKFVLQPLDDLNLAALLVSPLCGWTQEDLLEHGYREHGVSLWRHLREKLTDDVKLAVPRQLLRIADYETPYLFFEEVLSGQIAGRAKLRARLGGEILDPVNEFMGIAREFERDHIATLQNFMAWFENGDEEIKRENAEGANEVRVLTVHGAKGLQAPIVVLADAASSPVSGGRGGFDWKLDSGASVPLFNIRKDERVGAVRLQHDAVSGSDAKEFWRLLYVAMTRAEEHLFIGGALPLRMDAPDQASWYGQIEAVLDDTDSQESESEIWGRAVTFGDALQFRTKRAAVAPRAGKPEVSLPPWLHRAAPEEEQPPRPLAPSRLGEDDVVDPPAMAGDGGIAARRGILMHHLFEHLPGIKPDRRRDVASRWLERQGGMGESSEREAMVEQVLNVLEDSRWSKIFSDAALAEAPIAARVGSKTISGTVDRLLLAEDHILVVDFKTSRHVPGDMSAIPRIYLRQMAAYCAVLAKVFPEKPVRAALLYSAGPQLFELPDEVLDPFKPV